jgi:hypothetical protein
MFPTQSFSTEGQSRGWTISKAKNYQKRELYRVRNCVIQTSSFTCKGNEEYRLIFPIFLFYLPTPSSPRRTVRRESPAKERLPSVAVHHVPNDVTTRCIHLNLPESLLILMRAQSREERKCNRMECRFFAVNGC